MLWYIGLGSALGGMSRYLLGGLVQRAAGAGFPAGTMAVNILGSFLLGLLLRYSLNAPMGPNLRAALTAGFCGGFTTFSTFSYETVELLQDGQWGRAGIYVGLSLVVSLAAVWAGFLLARELV